MVNRHGKTKLNLFEQLNENLLGVMNTLWLEAEHQDADRRRKLKTQVI